MTDTVRVERLLSQHVRQKEVADVCSLLSQLKGERVEIPLSRIRRVADENWLTVARTKANSSIVGMAMLIVTNRFSATVARVEEVVVDENHRGMGVARAIMESLIACAKELDVQRLELTSNASRAPAHALYRSLGFEVRDTTVFRLELK